jgi:pyridoxine 4-dehydrogenase
MLPIPGTSSVAHLEENLAAAALRLTGDEFQLLGLDMRQAERRR